MNTIPEHPYRVQPSSVVALLGERMQAAGDARLDVLDYGCGRGRNAHYLGFLGHSVLGVSDDFADVSSAAQDDFSSQAQYVVGDVRRPCFKKTFEAVLINEVLSYMPKAESNKVIRSARSLTRPGGWNAVSGYLVSADTVSETYKERCLGPNELLQSYANMGWEIIDYHETVKPATYFGEREMINSLASIIARKPK